MIEEKHTFFYIYAAINQPWRINRKGIKKRQNHGKITLSEDF
jgi:hypothetical protein